MRRAVSLGLGAWAAIALWIAAVRAIEGDQSDAHDLAVTVSIIAASLFAPCAGLWVIVSPRPLLAGLLAGVWTAVAVFGGAELGAALFPKANEAAGPAVMAWLLPLLTGFGVLLPALLSRLLLGASKR
ncbi:MAG: hypothetical protein ACK4XK_09635 [Casimicrobiaceae bacterium]